MQRTQEAMRQVYEVADFVRATRRRLRFGGLSRAPSQILRLQLPGDFAECDWMTRPPDVWDSKLPLPARNESTSRQALADAMALPLENSLAGHAGEAVRVSLRAGERLLETPEARRLQSARPMTPIPGRGGSMSRRISHGGE